MDNQGNDTPAEQPKPRRSRWAEPSTWAGFAAVLGTLAQVAQQSTGGLAIDPTQVGAIAAAVAAVVMRESR